MKEATLVHVLSHAVQSVMAAKEFRLLRGGLSEGTGALWASSLHAGTNPTPKSLGFRV